MCLLKENISIMSTIHFQPTDSYTYSIWKSDIQGKIWTRLYHIKEFRVDLFRITFLFMDEDKLIMLFESCLDFALFDVKHLSFRYRSIYRPTHPSLMAGALYQESFA